MHSASKRNPELRSIKLDLSTKLQNKEYRRRFFRRQAQDEIAMQIRELRERRNVRTQSAFGRLAGMLQSAVSRIENAEYQGWTFRTLLKVADALDARLRITFEPAEDVIARYARHEKDAELDGGEESTDLQRFAAYEWKDHAGVSPGVTDAPAWIDVDSVSEAELVGVSEPEDDYVTVAMSDDASDTLTVTVN